MIATAEAKVYKSTYAETTATTGQRLIQKVRKCAGAIIGFFKEDNSWDADYRRIQQQEAAEFYANQERERQRGLRLKEVYSSLAEGTIDRLAPPKRPGVLRGVKGPVSNNTGPRGILIEQVPATEPWPMDPNVPRTSIYDTVKMDGTKPMVRQRVFCPTVDNVAIYASYGQFGPADQFRPEIVTAGEFATDGDLFELRSMCDQLVQRQTHAAQPAA